MLGMERSQVVTHKDSTKKSMGPRPSPCRGKRGIMSNFSSTVAGARGGETHVSIGLLFENVRNAVPQSSAISLDRPIFK